MVEPGGMITSGRCIRCFGDLVGLCLPPRRQPGGQRRVGGGQDGGGQQAGIGGAGLADGEREQLQGLLVRAEKMQERVGALESILDAEVPGWRNKV